MRHRSPATPATFTPESAAYVAGLPVRVVRRWIYGDADGPSVLVTNRKKGEWLSFVDVVELMVLHEIRRVRAIPLNNIRQTIETAAKYGIDRPFARKHKTYLLGNQIAIDVSGQLIQATGHNKHQQIMKPIVERFLERLVFDDRTELAAGFVAMEAGGYKIALDANKSFGAPRVTPVGYTVSAIVNTIDTEGSVAMAARTLEIPEAAARLAQQYDRDRRQAAVAKAA